MNNKASNLACRAEQGRLPLIMEYFVYLKDNCNVVKQSFFLSKHPHSVNDSSTLDLETKDNDKTKRYTNYMKENLSGETVLNI